MGRRIAGFDGMSRKYWNGQMHRILILRDTIGQISHPIRSMKFVAGDVLVGQYRMWNTKENRKTCYYIYDFNFNSGRRLSDYLWLDDKDIMAVILPRSGRHRIDYARGRTPAMAFVACPKCGKNVFNWSLTCEHCHTKMLWTREDIPWIPGKDTTVTIHVEDTPQARRDVRGFR